MEKAERHNEREDEDDDKKIEIVPQVMQMIY
jgi:hypothetical protein